MQHILRRTKQIYAQRGSGRECTLRVEKSYVPEIHSKVPQTPI